MKTRTELFRTLRSQMSKCFLVVVFDVVVGDKDAVVVDKDAADDVDENHHHSQFAHCQTTQKQNKKSNR